MKKILIIRFSSIGDIVLTTPVIRCASEQLNGSEIHFITKKKFKATLENNPYISKLWTIEKTVTEIAAELKKENFDYIIDLHNNARSLQTKILLGKKSKSFSKLNLAKWLTVNFKRSMPHNHIVDRYFNAAAELNLKNDGKGLDFFIAKSDEVHIASQFGIAQPFIAIAIGAQFATKRLPTKKIISICNKINEPIILIGGKEDAATAGEIIKNSATKIISACGKLNLNQSASVVKQAATVITHDTGMMHIAAAFQKKIISVWGNTIPAFGMSPYFSLANPEGENRCVEVKNLACRPCSKIGYKQCPKGHFNCMNNIDENEIISAVKKFM